MLQRCTWLKPLLLLLPLVTSVLAQQPPQLGVDVEQLRSLVQRESRVAATQAVEFGMWVDDREILTMAVGQSMQTVPARTDMHFRIGGISEMFLATLTMRLVEEQRLDLQDRLSRWFPQLLNADQVTLEMLLANTAGYPDYVRQPDFIEAATRQPYRQWTVDEMVEFALRKGTMNFPPGTSQAYSHTEYLLLGEVLVRHTGQTMAELYRHYVIEPAGFKHTELPIDQEIQAPVLHAFTTDRGVFEEATYFNPSWAYSYGGLTSNLHDLGRWGSIFGKGQLISAESFRHLTSNESVGKGRNRAQIYFAKGFVTSNGWFVQSPDMNGYTGGFAYHPGLGVTLVVAATRGPHPNPETPHPAMHILRAVSQYVTPEQPVITHF